MNHLSIWLKIDVNYANKKMIIVRLHFNHTFVSSQKHFFYIVLVAILAQNTLTAAAAKEALVFTHVHLSN